MTIKKRLFISNILMVVVPVVISVVTTMIIMIILSHTVYRDMLIDIGQNRELSNVKLFGKIDASVRAALLMLISLSICGYVAVMFITNRLLTRFVFRKIEQPLDILSEGVRQIQDGNLDFRIDYHSPDEFLQICGDFNEMAGRLRASVDATIRNEHSRKELLAGISHDLRSPLTSIKAYVEGLLDGVAATPESQREYLRVIGQKADDINNMVSKLFLFSKLDMGDYPYLPERVDIAEALDAYIGTSQEKGFTIRCDAPQGKLFAFVDPTQLRSVFQNILDNAAQYATEVIIRCSSDGRVITIVFEDNGPGVPEDALPKLFDVFYRNDPSRSRPEKGSGLGLAIVKKALERMGGGGYAQNINGGGLRIVVTIPKAGDTQ